MTDTTHTTMPLKQLKQRIEALCMQRLGGNFKQSLVLDGGLQVTFRFSWSHGMGWTYAISRRYKDQFGSVPEWLNLLNPIHRIRLCLDAMQEGQKLPDTLPAGTIPFIYYVCMLGD